MLKGKMKMELTDVNTGEKEVIVEHNMITNALANIFKPIGMLKGSAEILSQLAPYYKNLLGGILLFESPIEENVNNVYADAGNKMVGCGVFEQQNSSKGVYRGGYNQVESEVNLTSKTAKFVYDFTTSQANGEISCVALTSLNGGYCSYGGKNLEYVSARLGMAMGPSIYRFTNYENAVTRTSSLNVGNYEGLFLIDPKEDVEYTVRVDSPNALTIRKRRTNLKSVSVFENPLDKSVLVDEIKITDLAEALPQNYICFNYDEEADALYLYSGNGSAVAKGGKFVVTKVNCKTWKAVQYTLTNTTEYQLYVSTISWVYKGYFVTQAYGKQNLFYKIELANPANVIEIKYQTKQNFEAYPVIAIHGMIYYEYYNYNYNSYMFVLNMETNEMSNPECNGIFASSRGTSYAYLPLKGYPMHYYSSNGYLIVLGNYLATINNLTESVQKTADKTMKVTYIIQEE